MVDAFQAVTQWLPGFIWSAALIYAIVMMTDAIKHATLALFHTTWLDQHVYVSFRGNITSHTLAQPRLYIMIHARHLCITEASEKGHS